ncbi:MAG TPA: family 78 glycoside hydrolase catalytic domain [Amnibacterium sp.]|nr:family 78 glycoside hydrolase catalytic domain [Amnibacterium sp.]
MTGAGRPWPRSWAGHWITAAPPADPGTEGSLGAPGGGGTFARTLFRTAVELDAVPAAVPARITADSRYLLLVNGVEVGRGPVRSQPHRLHYDEYDLAPALAAGTNRIVVLVTYYGTANSFWQPAAANQGLGRAGVLVFEADLGDRVLATDDTWEVADAPAWTTVPMRGLDGVPVECLDARLLDAGWRSGDAAGLGPARIAPAIHLGALARSQPPTDPYGPLKPRPIGPLGGDRVTPRTLRVARVDPGDPGTDPVDHVLRRGREPGPDAEDHLETTVDGPAAFVLRADFGRIVAGLVEFDLEAPAGTVVDLLYREKAPAPGDARVNSVPRTGARYIARGADDRFRALEVNGLRYVDALITVPSGGDVALSGLAVQERIQRRQGDAFFRSSDPELDALYAAGIRTVELNAHDSYIDCPTREQRAWVGDGVVHQSVQLTTSTDWRMAAWYVELAASPRPDGILPMSVVGEIESGGGHTIPDWSLYWVRGVRTLLEYTGDRAAIEAAAPVVRRVLEWFVPYVGDRGVLVDVPEWVLVDWSSVLLSGASSILTALWVRGLQDYAAIARFLGNPGDAAWAERHVERARAGFDLFWDEERGTYVDQVVGGEQRLPASQLAGATAIVAGLVPLERVPRVIDWIGDERRQVVRSWVGGAGGYDEQRILAQLRGVQEIDWDAAAEVVVAEPFAAHLVHDAYLEAGRPELVLASIRRWSAFLADGYDTFGECWGWGTPVHGWSSTPTRDLVVGLLGVTPAEPGFTRARVAPAYGLVDEVEGAVPTPAGLLRVRVDRDAVTVDSPVPVLLVDPDGVATEHPAGRSALALHPVPAD